MTVNDFTKVTAILTKHGIFRGDLPTRSLAASAIAMTDKRFDDGIIHHLRQHFVSEGKDPDSYICQALNSGEWVNICDKVISGQNSSAEERLDYTKSGMEWVVEGNPYGWFFDRDNDEALPPKANDHMEGTRFIRGEDHNRAGEWNEYRQCFNMKVKEIIEHKASDARRGGCSRYDVLGNVRGVDPKPVWDPFEVERAKLPDHVTPQGPQPPTPSDQFATKAALDREPDDDVKSLLPEWCSRQSHRISRDIQRRAES